ncbi:MFS transporter [Aulographum hederae CBS 113979]|uniref:MFS transporter n=1 Tax=Aulographum hederae CBS 113979 TaxID=1176131 RepID=A0A6G1HEA2_9PEZI|nr:MFS transporter [Aulographum hederae CBS 113979]
MSPTTSPKPSAVNEITPLLAASSSGPTAQANEGPIVDETPQDESSQQDEDRPLPMDQILTLCYIRLIEPISYFSIFPYINKMIFETGGIEEEDVGFYSGLIESLFSCTQMCVMIFWGRAADRWGRKPTLIVSLIGATIACSLFGFSQNIWQMVVFRCCAGAFAGTIVTVRAMITENSTPKTQARAFSLFAFSGNLGIMLGPLIGGSLEHLDTKFPDTFGHNKFMINYPYAVPTLITGAFGISATLFGVFMLKETLVKKSGSSSDTQPMSTMEILRSPGVPQVLLVFGWVALNALGYTAVVPIFWFEPPTLGGFGLSPVWISIFLAISGASQAIWILFVFPPLQTRYGSKKVMFYCACLFPVTYALAPVFNTFLRRGWVAAFWATAPAAQALGSCVSMAFTAIQLCLNAASPSPTAFGTLNALALTLNSAIRAFTPGLFASVYATGVKHQILGGHLIWLILAMSGVGMAAACLWLPDEGAPGVRGKVVDREERGRLVNGDGSGSGYGATNGNGNAEAEPRD